MSANHYTTRKSLMEMTREIWEIVRSRSAWRNIPTVITIVGFISAIFGILPTVSNWVHLIVSLVLGVLSLIYIAWLIVDVSFELGRRRGREAECTPEPRKQVHEIISLLHGFQYARLELHGQLQADGSMIFTRTMEVVASQPEIGSIDHYMHTPEAPKRLGQNAPQIDLPSVNVEKGKCTATARIHQQSQDHIRFIVDFTPALPVGEPVVYTTTERYSPQTFAVTYDRLQQHPTSLKDREFHAWDITHPTKSFRFEIEFPPNLQPTAFEPEVWRGHSRAVHNVETRAIWNALRLVPNKGRNSTSLVLEVEYPLLQLTYVIKWRPPNLTTVA